VAVRAPLAARQVAGLALPTRSVQRLPSSPALRARPIPHVGRARTARSFFSFTSALAVVTLTAAALAWLAGRPQFVLQLPSGTVELLERITATSAAASVIGLAVGLVAMVLWTIRRVVVALLSRFDRRPSIT
jgi:hypothetical protein